MHWECRQRNEHRHVQLVNCQWHAHHELESSRAEQLYIPVETENKSRPCESRAAAWRRG
ncbi:hypothetical protein PVAP13_6NG114506 [Panicum virgatum]|uniref:Uncharacterized protein n=1 Tax=Panicum virgatum TaxID=38727 RepID=A0A8T0R0P2_PANVG|nr:hypothetical protein PVAP13_6NG114506 [Panicum virgatum]